jgi:hypothetical protein
MRRRRQFRKHRRPGGDERAASGAPEPPPPQRCALAAAVEARRATVERDLAAAAGGASLCSISRSGRPVDGVKYLEGQAMLTELLRGLRSAPGTDGEVLTEVAQQWRAALNDAVQRELGGGWIAYRSGGSDEADELLGVQSDPRQDGRGPH